jgi:hypothetical protein
MAREKTNQRDRRCSQAGRSRNDAGRDRSVGTVLLRAEPEESWHYVRLFPQGTDGRGGNLEWQTRPSFSEPRDRRLRGLLTDCSPCETPRWGVSRGSRPSNPLTRRTPAVQTGNGRTHSPPGRYQAYIREALLIRAPLESCVCRLRRWSCFGIFRWSTGCRFADPGLGRGSFPESSSSKEVRGCFLHPNHYEVSPVWQGFGNSGCYCNRLEGA